MIWPVHLVHEMDAPTWCMTLALDASAGIKGPYVPACLFETWPGTSTTLGVSVFKFLLVVRVWLVEVLSFQIMDYELKLQLANVPLSIPHLFHFKGLFTWFTTSRNPYQKSRFRLHANTPPKQTSYKVHQSTQFHLMTSVSHIMILRVTDSC